MFKITNNRKRTFRGSVLLLIALLLITGLTAACGTESAGNAQETAAAAYPLTVTDEQGHDVVIPAKPTKIFAPMLEDSLTVLGIKPAMQWSNGVQPQLYLQDQLVGVPEISFASGLPSSEALMAYEPDLIILHNSFYAENGVYEQYAKIAPTYVFESASTNLPNTLQVLGQLLDESAKAEQAQADYTVKVDAAKTKLASLIEGKKAAIIRFNAKGMFYMNSHYYSGYVLAQELGFGQSELVKGGAVEVSLEILPELDTDYIFLVNDGNQGDAFVKELKDSKVWQAVPAVKKGQVYETTSDYWLSGGYMAQAKVIDDVLGFLAP